MEYSSNTLLVGGAIENGQVNAGKQVRMAMSTLNRHGLISGATGTGKTISLQVMVEELSLNGIPSLVLDVKGDLSGLGASGSINPIIEQRSQKIGMQWKPQAFPLEFMSLSDEPGTPLRSTVSEFGPMILSRMLSLNDTQSSLLSMLFLYCDKQGLALLDLEDLKAILQFASGEGRTELQEHFGLVSTSSLQAILRAVINLEQQGGMRILGEPSFDTKDLLRRDIEGKGVINVIRVTDMQSKPMLFSTFMLALLAEVYSTFPEKGDVEKPELMLFIDEAHLLFRSATKELLQQLDIIIKLIRSKGIGIVFITQSPEDIPEKFLSQLGFKIQHALRAFTAKQRKAIKLMAQNFPETSEFDVNTLLTELGIGEALVSSLDSKGKPTPLTHTLMRPPYSRMGILNMVEIEKIITLSELFSKYKDTVDRESASELLRKRMEYNYQKTQTSKKKTKARRVEKTALEEVLRSPVTTTLVRELTRGLLGALGLKRVR